jgi:GcrA cell cycle regulator
MATLDMDLAEVDDETIDLIDPQLIEGLTIADLTASSCRWPNGDPRNLETFRYCGKAAQGGPYCERHSRLAYYRWEWA